VTYISMLTFERDARRATKPERGSAARRATSTPEWLRRLLQGLACVLLIATFDFPMAVSADSAGQGLHLVGSITPGTVDYGAGGFDYGHVLVADSTTDVGFAVAHVSAAGSVVREYDLAQFRSIRDIPAPGAGGLGQGYGASPARPVAVVDHVHHRVIFAEEGPAQPPTGTCPYGATDAFAVLDEVKLAWTQLPVACVPPGVVPGSGANVLASADDADIAGMAYDDVHSALYAVLMDAWDQPHQADGGPVRHYLEQLDDITGRVGWRMLLPDCNTAQDFNNTAGYGGSILVSRHGDMLDVMCLKADNQQEATSRQANIPILIRVPLGPNGQPNGAIQESFLMGSSFGGLFDPGSASLVVVSDLAGYDYGGYIIDAGKGLFRGFVATGNDTTFNGMDDPHEVGLDVSRGRLYMRTQSALVVADVGHSPLSAGIAVSGLADKWRWSNEMALPIATDSNRHRLFLYDRTAQKYLVLQDDIPAAPPSPLSNADSATQDVPEAPGVTGVAFSASGDAFGARVLSEGGPNRLLNSETGSCPPAGEPTTSGQNSALDQLLLGLQECQADLLLTPGDRDWVFGHVARLSSSTLGAAAEAAAVDAVDSATGKDLSDAGTYGTTAGGVGGLPKETVPGAQSVGDGGIAPVESPYLTFPVDRPQDRPRCFDSGGARQRSGEQSAAGGAALDCDQTDNSVSATAAAGGGSPTVSGASSTPSPGAMDLGEYWSQVRSWRDPVRGLVTTATAVARNVQIPVPGGPAILIREISTTAETSAHGRPGTAHGSFTRHIYGFRSAGQPKTAADYACSDDSATPCDDERVAAAITADMQQAGLDAQATAPLPDSSYVNGSVGGYQAVVTKDASFQANDRTVNDDTTDTADGLQIVLVEDGTSGKAREVIQLAGVHTESHYGIYSLSPEGEAPSVAGAPAPFLGGSPPAADPRGNERLTPPQDATSAQKPPGGVVGALRHIANIIRETWRLLISDPKTAAMLAGVWLLLLGPAYLAARRRSLVRTYQGRASA
jgi:hypothetical protein